MLQKEKSASSAAESVQQQRPLLEAQATQTAICMDPTPLEVQGEKGEMQDGILEPEKKKIRITITYDENDMEIAKFRSHGWKNLEKKEKADKVVMHISRANPDAVLDGCCSK